MKLTNYIHGHQVATPWGEHTASFQVGAGPVSSIESTPEGIVVRATVRKYEVGVEPPLLDQWVMVFPGGGYGFGPELHTCDRCDKYFGTATALGAHKRSHKPNHKGSET